jgi:tetratricopeptide (TPR) repeat protein
LITSEKENVLKLFAEGRALYKEQRFREAYERFNSALVIDANDGPSKLYRARCKHYMDNPPGPGWDGVFTATSK